MLNRFALPLATAAVALGTLVSLPGASAQVPFTVTVHDSVAMMRGEQVIELKATITNTSPAPIEIRAIRTLNELPDSTWATAMCFGDLCFAEDLNVTPPSGLEPGETMIFKLTVASDSVTYGTGRVRAAIRFDTGPITDGVEANFVVTIDGTSSAPDESRMTVLSARPNPAHSVATLPLSAGASATPSAHVQLIDAMGNVVVDDAHAAVDASGARIDVANVPNGAYVFRVVTGEFTSIGRIVVAH